MAFYQSPPELGNQFSEDAVLREYLEAYIPRDLLRQHDDALHTLGALAGGELYVQSLAEHRLEPSLTQWDAWGKRIDRIDVTPLWAKARRLACEFGLIATGYESHAWARPLQFARVYLFDASTDTYACPLAMTDGAAKTVRQHAAAHARLAYAFSRLTSRDANDAWTSGQWMTERTGGSDVGLSETLARSDGAHTRLYGTKWFTSATTSDMALTLARREHADTGSRGLSLFYVEQWRPDGTRNGITVNRLKDKLGTRKLPTAELTLDGTDATQLGDDGAGVKNIAPMLNVTRLWNSVSALAHMRRAIALARSYADKRVAFGQPLIAKALHADTLADLQSEFEAMFMLTFTCAQLLGVDEAGSPQPALRALTPLCKLITAKAAVHVVSEAAECLGGAGYVEDVGMAKLVRNTHVLPIWEGTTNVLSLEFAKALASEEAREQLTYLAVTAEAAARPLFGSAASDQLQRWHAALQAARRDQTLADGEANARRRALRLGRTLAGLLLAQHAAATSSVRAAAATRRYWLRDEADTDASISDETWRDTSARDLLARADVATPKSAVR